MTTATTNLLLAKNNSDILNSVNFTNNLDLLNQVTNGNAFLATSGPLNTNVTTGSLLAATSNSQILSTNADIINPLLLNNSNIISTVNLLNSQNQKQPLKRKSSDDLNENELLYQNEQIFMNNLDSNNSPVLNSLMNDTSYLLSKTMETTETISEIPEILVNSQLEEKKFRSEVECLKREEVQRLLTNYEKRCEFLRGYLMATRPRN